MIYEAPLERVRRQSEIAFSEAPPGAIMVALRVKDFKCEIGASLRTLDEAYRAVPAYGGWASFAYNAYRDRATCPASCCSP